MNRKNGRQARSSRSSNHYVSSHNKLAKTRPLCTHTDIRQNSSISISGTLSKWSRTENDLVCLEAPLRHRTGLHFCGRVASQDSCAKGPLSLGAKFDLDQIVLHQVRGRSCTPWEELGSGRWLVVCPILPPIQLLVWRCTHACLLVEATSDGLPWSCPCAVREAQKRRSSLETALRVLGRKTPGPSQCTEPRHPGQLDPMWCFHWSMRLN